MDRAGRRSEAENVKEEVMKKRGEGWGWMDGWMGRDGRIA